MFLCFSKLLWLRCSYLSVLLLSGGFTCANELSEPSESVPSALKPLKIGVDGLSQKIISDQLLAPGIQFYHVIRGELSVQDHYRLSSGVVDMEHAKKYKKKLVSLGYEIDILAIAESGPLGKPLGVEVVAGRFDKVDKAKKLSSVLKSSNLQMAVRFTAEDGGATSGPFDISILEIDLNRYQGRIESALAKDQVIEKETTSSIAKRKGAVAAVNAGFFTWKKEVGTVGDPAGVSVIDGELVSEATEGRPALVIRNTRESKSGPNVQIVHNLRSQLWLKFGDQRFLINGLNRKPGKILNCGNQSAKPVVQPAHDFVCTNSNELILFNRYFAEKTPEGEGFEFSISQQGNVISPLPTLGRYLASTKYVLQAQGETAKSLEKLVSAGMGAEVEIQLTADEGELELNKGLYIVNGGPTLLQIGQMDLSARAREGWAVHFDEPSINDQFINKKDAATVGGQVSGNRTGFYHGWVVRRHSRTVIGLTEDNVLYVVVIYGRQPGVSAGASLTDMAQLMRNLGVSEALNLDGGGSSAMVVQNELTGLPSDASGEREVGDALLFFPSGPDG